MLQRSLSCGAGFSFVPETHISKFADEYVQIMDDLNDYLLLTMAVERMSSYDPSALVSEEDVDRRLGITQEELDSIGEVEFE